MASDDNKLSDLERLIAEEKEDKARQNEIIDGRNTKAKRKKVGAITAVATVSVALIAGLIIYDPFTQSIRWSDNSNTVPGYTGGTTKDKAALANDPFGWAKTTGSIFPVKTNEWEEKSYLDSSQTGATDEKLGKYQATDLYQASAQLPSEASGYTSDDSKSFNENGSLNPLYSYWTRESFYSETTDLLERLINPVYGSWDTYQYSQTMGGAYPVLSKIFSDVIDPDTLAAGTGAETIPVFADWAGNDYGMGDQLLSYDEGKRWVGEVKSVQTTFNFNEDLNQYDVILVANVTYSAWTKSKEVVTKDGVLTLNLGANNDKKVASPNKVIIKSAKLEF